jgi:curved DNA-binding protein CbpA
VNNSDAGKRQDEQHLRRGDEWASAQSPPRPTDFLGQIVASYPSLTLREFCRVATLVPSVLVVLDFQPNTANLENVGLQLGLGGTFASGDEPVRTSELSSVDYYEILKVAPQADEDTIERVYRTLADRFNPDNPDTGDSETFLRLGEAYETLSDPARRAQYNVSRQVNGGAARFWLRGREFFEGLRGRQNRRLAILCLLYRQKTSACESRGLTILDLEQLTGCTSEEITSALWYLCEKKWTVLGESTAYNITVDGFDNVESKLEDQLEFRSLATLCYYSSAVTGESRFGKDVLSLAFASTRAIEGEVIADHYEALGIGPGADEEAIERVYRTLAGRFGPDSPGTDANTFQRIQTAYETLSSSARRAEYDALRWRTQCSTQSRLQGREFFDGIRGEQLRRLAVLCLLYRRAITESPGLTVLDLEQLTGCTREELASALWYLREKKWARSSENTEFSITAAGFDIVENRLEDLEAAGARAWRRSRDISETDLVAPAQTTLLAERRPEDPQTITALVPQQNFSGVVMNSSTYEIRQQAIENAVRPEKRVVFSMGGKGGVGKTNVMTGLAEWFEENRIPVAMLDLDTENKAKGSLSHFFGSRAPKINIHTPAGLDAFIDILAEDAAAILADMGAGAGHVAHDWFEKMYPDAASVGIVFTAVGVVTPDPASVESVVNWAAALEERVAYVIVENHLTDHADFSYWRDNDKAQDFRARFHPAVIRLDCRLADLENSIRTHGVTLGRVAGRTAPQPELQKASLVMRAQSYRRRMFEEFDKVRELLLP